MLKKSSIKTRRKFLNDFTNEVIAIVHHQGQSELKARESQERINRERRVERLTKKYIKPKEQSLISESGFVKYKKPEPKPIKETEKIKREIVKKPEPRKIEKPVTKPIAPTPRPPKPRPMPVFKPLPKPKSPESPFDLRKIQVLLDDREITSIECPGEDKELIVKKRGQLMKTEIKLNKEDIAEVIRQFSEKARIPLIEGLLRARVADLQISAVVSKAASSRFIITRVLIEPVPGQFVLERRFQRVPSRLERPPIPRTNPSQQQRPIPPIQRPFIARPAPTPKPQMQQPPKQSIPPKPPMQAQSMQQPMTQPQQMPPQSPMPPQQAQPIQAQPPQIPPQPPMPPQQAMASPPQQSPTTEKPSRFEGMQPSIASHEAVPAKEMPAPPKKEKK